jgi:hypothetical protein
VKVGHDLEIDGDMCAMPIRSESNQIKHHKTKDLNVQESGQPF